jgi:hypothetical protein
MESREGAEPVVSRPANMTQPRRRAGRGRSWDRGAGIAGIMFIVLGVANLVTPRTPDPQLATADFTAQMGADLTGHQLSLWLGFLASAAFMVFLTGLAGRMLRFEDPGAGFASLLRIAGTAYVAVLLLSLGAYLALVQYGSTSEPDAAVRTALDLLVGWLGAGQIVPALVAELAIGAAVLTTGALPRWLGWLTAATAVFTLLSLAWNIQTATDGILGIADTIGFWLSVAWVLAISLVLLLRPGDEPEST